MSRTITKIDPAVDSFSVWINRTNDLLISLATEIITANDAGANTGSVAEPRKAQLLGFFGANTLIATNNLRGGNIGDLGSALLTISSNTVVGGNSSIGNASFFHSYANVFFENANTQVNSQIITVTGNSYIKGNTSVVAINVLGNSSVTNTIVQGTDIFVRTTNTSVNSRSIFTGNTFVKSNTTITLLEMKGNGTTSNTIMGGNLVQITANLDVTGSNHTIAGNVNFDSGTLFVDASGNKIGIGTTTPDANLQIVGTANVSGAVRLANTLVTVGNVSFANTLSVIGNTVLSNSIAVTGNSSLTGPVTFGNNFSYYNDFTMVSLANGNIGTDVVNPVTIFQFSKTEFSSAKIVAQIKSLSGNTQISEMVTAYSATDNAAHMTVYATVTAPLTQDLGDFSVDVTASNVQIKLLQRSISSATKVVATLIK